MFKEFNITSQYDLLFTDWTRLGLKLFYKLSNMLYGGNALSDLLDNVFIVEAGKSAPGYLWRCLPLDLALHTSSSDLIDVLFCWFQKHIQCWCSLPWLETGRQLVDVVNLSPVEIIITWLGLIISPIFALPVYQLPASKASKVGLSGSLKLESGREWRGTVGIE